MRGLHLHLHRVLQQLGCEFGDTFGVGGRKQQGLALGGALVLALTLMSTVVLKLPEQLALFTAILLVHNTFGAMQDVAIDALVRFLGLTGVADIDRKLVAGEALSPAMRAAARAAVASTGSRRSPRARSPSR